MRILINSNSRLSGMPIDEDAETLPILFPGLRTAISFPRKMVTMGEKLRDWNQAYTFRLSFQTFCGRYTVLHPWNHLCDILSTHPSREMVRFLYSQSIPELSIRNKCELPIQSIDENVLASALEKKKEHLKRILRLFLLSPRNPKYFNSKSI